jgi:hypothetical protein
MPFVRRYKGLNTDLDALYNGIVQEFQNTKELNISNELNGNVNGVPFRSVTATRVSLPRVIVGALREVTVTISGKPDDYVIELHSGAWFANMIVPVTGALLVTGPLGLAVVAGTTALLSTGAAVGGTTALLSANYTRTLKNRLKELVKQHSKESYTDEKIETFV